MQWYFLKITYLLESSLAVYIIIICIKNILCGTSATPKLYSEYQTYTSLAQWAVCWLMTYQQGERKWSASQRVYRSLAVSCSPFDLWIVVL